MTETTQAVSLWDDKTQVAEIQKTLAPNLSQTEFNIFLGIGKATGLNPFKREIWAVKYGSNPASIFIGRDGYRKFAQSHPDYDYHFIDSIYANDTFRVRDGIVEHDYATGNR